MEVFGGHELIGVGVLGGGFTVFVINAEDKLNLTPMDDGGFHYGPYRVRGP